MNAPIDYPGQGLAYLDDLQIYELRRFADAAIASGSYLQGARLRELLDMYPRGLDAEHAEAQLAELKEQGRELAKEIVELQEAVSKIEADLDEQIGIMKVALEPTPQPEGAKPTKKTQAISRQSDLLNIEANTKRAVDAVVEISSRLAQLKESLASEAKDVTEWCEEKKT